MACVQARASIFLLLALLLSTAPPTLAAESASAAGAASYKEGEVSGLVTGKSCQCMPFFRCVHALLPGRADG